MSNYKKLFTMVVTSTLIMFPLMYLNTYQLDHVFFSETRAYMAVLMGAVMMLVMLYFMRDMFKKRNFNIGIVASSLLLFVSSLYLVRSQDTIADVSWMKAMIPHHSIAILTSERANIKDPRVRKLADDIIKAQRKEILEMKGYIEDLENGRSARPVDVSKEELSLN